MTNTPLQLIMVPWRSESNMVVGGVLFFSFFFPPKKAPSGGKGWVVGDEGGGTNGKPSALLATLSYVWIGFRANVISALLCCSSYI